MYQMKITQVNNTSKYLFISSLVWNILYCLFSFGILFTVLILGNESLTCGHRSLVSIFYVFERISLMLFFMARLYHSFARTSFGLNKWMIRLSAIIVVALYCLLESMVIYIRYESEEENRLLCDNTTIIGVFASGYVMDNILNLSLGGVFIYKLRVVS